MLRSTVALAGLALVLGAPAGAVELSASSAASSASESASTSVGSLSQSVTRSSEASSGTEKTAEGDYRVRTVALLADRPGLVQVTLQAVDRPGPQGALTLTLPQVTAERARLAAGGTVQVRQRAFGLEFAQGPAREAFFLAVADDWLRDLAARPVAL